MESNNENTIQNRTEEEMEKVSGGDYGIRKPPAKPPKLVIYACEFCKFFKRVPITKIHDVDKTCPICGHKLILQRQ